jgi:hypothetical protein
MCVVTRVGHHNVSIEKAIAHLVLVDGHPAGRIITLNPDGTIITKVIVAADHP